MPRFSDADRAKAQATIAAKRAARKAGLVPAPADTVSLRHEVSHHVRSLAQSVTVARKSGRGADLGADRERRFESAAMQALMALIDPEKLHKASAKDLAIVLGILTDKARQIRLDREKPATISMGGISVQVIVAAHEPSPPARNVTPVPRPERDTIDGG